MTGEFVVSIRSGSKVPVDTVLGWLSTQAHTIHVWYIYLHLVDFHFPANIPCMDGMGGIEKYPFSKEIPNLQRWVPSLSTPLRGVAIVCKGSLQSRDDVHFYEILYRLHGGFKPFLFSPLFGEDSHFD